MTILSSVRLDESTAAMVIEGATDTLVFSAPVDRVLTPSLRSGDIVVMDNMPPHKRPEILQTLERSGVKVWHLPPYSPDFNPIEKMWSKIKAYQWKAKAGAQEALLRAIARALRTISASDVAGWLQYADIRDRRPRDAAACRYKPAYRDSALIECWVVRVRQKEAPAGLTEAICSFPQLGQMLGQPALGGANPGSTSF
jgi:transposase